MGHALRARSRGLREEHERRLDETYQALGGAQLQIKV